MLSSEKSQNAEGLLAEDHEELDKLLRALLRALDEGDAATAFARLDLLWARLAMHIRAENLHLFPTILKAVDDNLGEREDKILSSAEACETINKLRTDHDFFMHQLASAVKIMREILATNSRNSKARLDDVRQIISAVNERLKWHNRVEEELVYGLPASLLEPAEEAALEVQILGELENLPPRFSDTAATGKVLSERYDSR